MARSRVSLLAAIFGMRISREGLLQTGKDNRAAPEELTIGGRLCDQWAANLGEARGISMDEARQRLIQPDEPPPFAVEQAQGRSPFFLTADHAGKLLPRKLGDLGLDAKERERHIAWDIGIAEVSRRLAVQLDAFLILQTYSRLVIDCNRPPEADSSIVTVSELTAIPGNQNLN